jgi:hypothetical protein
MIVAVPGATAVTVAVNPVPVTVATPGFEDEYVIPISVIATPLTSATDAVMLAVAVPLSDAVVCKGVLPVVPNEIDWGGQVTTPCGSPCVVVRDAFIVAAPGRFPVTSPFASIVATEVSLEDQLNDAGVVDICLLPESKALALNCSV